jgi:hypothetical protein
MMKYGIQAVFLSVIIIRLLISMATCWTLAYAWLTKEAKIIK